MRTAVDLKKNIEFDAGLSRSLVELLNSIGVVSQQTQFYAAKQDFDRCVELSTLDRNRISDVAKSVLRKSMSLGQRRNGYRPVMPGRLYPGDLYALMRLDMRTQANVIAFCDVAHPLGVPAFCSFSRASMARPTSEPVAIRMSFGFAALPFLDSASAKTYAPLCRPLALANFFRSINATF